MMIEPDNMYIVSVLMNYVFTFSTQNCAVSIPCIICVTLNTTQLFQNSCITAF